MHFNVQRTLPANRQVSFEQCLHWVETGFPALTSTQTNALVQEALDVWDFESGVVLDPHYRSFGLAADADDEPIAVAFIRGLGELPAVDPQPKTNEGERWGAVALLKHFCDQEGSGFPCRPRSCG